MKAFDDTYRTGNTTLIAGVDEVGRGPLAGPVVAAAVVFPVDVVVAGVNDSKKLSGKKREELFDIIYDKALSVEFDLVSHEVIDQINILQASLLAMKNSINRLSTTPDLILIDGNKTFEHTIKRIAVVKGDSKSFSIAAASIIAKVVRDRLMLKLDEEFPLYRWSQNKGYPTKDHIEAVRKYGITPYHRKTFLRKILGEQIEFFR
jgi:ribonuclease HII